ncbi:MAG: RNA polymerase sigma factor [Chitinophagales bacterium]
MPQEQHIDLFADQNLRQELHNKAARILKCSQLADDAVQETYIKMMRYEKEISTQGDWKALCKNAIRWIAIDMLRKKKVIKKTLDTYLSNAMTKTSMNPYKKLEDKEKIAKMERLIAANSDERGQQMMWLRAKGYKYEHIAKELGTSIGSATGQVARIRKKLKSSMEKAANMKAEHQKIEQLLHKYWEANTNIEEEKTLEAFFASKNVPSHLVKFTPLFQHSKSIRDKANRKKVGKLLSLCSLIPVFVFAAYLLYTANFMGNSPQNSLQGDIAIQISQKTNTSTQNGKPNMVKILPCSLINKKEEGPYICRDAKEQNVSITNNAFSLSQQVELIEI